MYYYVTPSTDVLCFSVVRWSVYPGNSAMYMPVFKFFCILCPQKRIEVGYSNPGTINLRRSRVLPNASVTFSSSILFLHYFCSFWGHLSTAVGTLGFFGMLLGFNWGGHEKHFVDFARLPVQPCFQSACGEEIMFPVPSFSAPRAFYSLFGF